MNHFNSFPSYLGFSLILSTHVRLGLYLPLSGFPTETLYAPLFTPMRAACPHRAIIDFGSPSTRNILRVLRIVKCV